MQTAATHGAGYALLEQFIGVPNNLCRQADGQHRQTELHEHVRASKAGYCCCFGKMQLSLQYRLRASVIKSIITNRNNPNSGTLAVIYLPTSTYMVFFF